MGKSGSQQPREQENLHTYVDHNGLSIGISLRRKQYISQEIFAHTVAGQDPHVSKSNWKHVFRLYLLV